MTILLKWNIAIGTLWLLTSIWPGLLEQWKIFFLLLSLPLFFCLLPSLGSLVLGTIAFWEIQTKEENHRYVGWVAMIITTLFSPLLFPFSSLILLTWLTMAWLGLVQQNQKIFKLTRSVFLWGLILFFMLGIFVSNTPRCLGLIFSRPAFESIVNQVSIENIGESKWLNRYFGIYYVEQYASDIRGGVYFRTNTKSVFGREKNSYGFVYQPNTQGSPFGNANYAYQRLIDDWYSFSASDDF